MEANLTEKKQHGGQHLEVNLFDLAIYLWRRKVWVAGITFLFGLLGLAHALLTTPIFQSDSVLAPKDPAGNAQSGLISSLGGFGGRLAQGLGLGSSSVDHLEILLLSRGLAEKVLHDNDLMPRMFPKSWDAANKKWLPAEKGKIPKLSEAVEILRQNYLSINADDKKKLITLTVFSRDRQFSKEIASAYLKALNERMREDVRANASANRQYLEEQISSTADPLVREKIQQLIAMEIEKSMMVSSRSFDVLESPTLADYATKPKKKLIVLISLASGFLFSFLSLTCWKMGREAWAAYRPLSDKN